MKLRAAWRVPYTEPELAVLAAEVDACAARGVTFAYAISPGLDMVFSSDADVVHLKKKLLQVWGCLWRRALVCGACLVGLMRGLDDGGSGCRSCECECCRRSRRRGCAPSPYCSMTSPQRCCPQTRPRFHRRCGGCEAPMMRAGVCDTTAAAPSTRT